MSRPGCPNCALIEQERGKVIDGLRDEIEGLRHWDVRTFWANVKELGLNISHEDGWTLMKTEDANRLDDAKASTGRPEYGGSCANLHKNIRIGNAEPAASTASPEVSVVADARRYQWIRIHGCEYTIVVEDDGTISYDMLRDGTLGPDPKLLDAAIDAAVDKGETG
jgi:hypothetical protein